jgi:hypothetical protein
LSSRNNTEDRSFKREGEKVVFKIPKKHKWRKCCSDSRNDTVDCSFKRGGDMIVFKIPVEYNPGNVALALETVL